MKVLLKKNILKSFNLLLFLFFIFLLSCQKDPSEIGLVLQEENEIINGSTFDTVSIHAYTCFEDSITTDERTYALLGSYVDPVFGYTEASFITQMRLASSNVSFGSNPVADSMVIYLDYRSYYGDTTVPQSFEVYEIENSIYLDSTYYSNFNAEDLIPSQNKIATVTYYPRPNDSCLAIKLDSTFAQKIASAPAESLKDNNAFLNYFKGFYFKALQNNQQASIIYFNLLSNKTKITLFYKNDNEPKKYDFLINSSCARINLFKHDYTNSTFYLNINDSTASDSLLYLQAMAGLKVKIKFPFIKQFAQQPQKAFVKAELIIPFYENDNTESMYKKPTKLLLVAYNKDGQYEFLPDYYVGSSYFGGEYNSQTKEYRFNITRYIQRLAYQNVSDYGLALFVADNRISANRVIVKGPGCIKGMRLAVTYLNF